MPSRRENIVARFVTRGAQRFKQEVHGVARKIADVGHESAKTSAEFEVLQMISSRLERQHETLILIEHKLASEINDVGDEANKTSAKLTGLGVASRHARGGYKASGLLGLLGVTGRLKDMLSLTGSELRATALTMALYLSPAILELGASFASAVTGAGLVGGAGLVAMITGLSGLMLISKTAGKQIKQVTNAQKAYNLAVAQFGAGSAEASRANARLFAAIQTNGGRQVWDAVQATNALKQAWTKRTAPARGSFYQIISAAMGTGQRLLPTFASETNKNMATIRGGASGVFSQLGGPEMRKNIRVFSGAFRAMFGPITRGGTNLLFALLRLLRVAAPYAILWANAFERWTQSLRRGSRDQAGLAKFVSNAVDNFKAWWALLGAVGRLLVTVFKGSNQQGEQLVYTLTGIVDKFNTWLGAIGTDGQTRVARFFTSFNENLNLLFADPGKFIQERVVPFGFKIASSLIQAIVTGWFQADWRTKLLSAAWLGFMLIRAYATGRITGRAFASGFAASAGSGIKTGMAGGAAEGALAGGFFSRWGSRLGSLASKAFVGVFLYDVLHSIANQFPALSQYSGKKGWGELWHDVKKRFGGEGVAKAQAQQRRRFHGRKPPVTMHGKGFAAGGTIPWGTSALIGELGPEVMSATPSGMQIKPMGFGAGGSGGLRSMESMLSISDMLPPVHVHMNVGNREIGRAVVDWTNSTASKRGGRKLNP